MTILDLKSDEYIPYFKGYIDLAVDVELIPGLISGLNTNLDFYKSIEDSKLDYRYTKGKWSIKEIISHLIDTERIFCYRALRFARQDKTTLLGFNENDYVDVSNASNRSLDSLLKEYESVRQATLTLFKSFDNQTLKSKGIAGAGEVSVRALGFLIIGHEIHHNNVIRRLYL